RSKLEFVSVLKTSGVSDHGVEGGEGLGITVSLGSSVAASRQAGRKETQSFDSGMLSLGEGLRLSADMATEITPLPVWRRQELKKAQASQALLAIVEEERGLGSDEVAFSSLSSSWAKLWGWLLLSAGLLMMSWVLWGRHSVGVETQRDASTPKPVVRTIPEKKREDVVRLVLQTKPVFATVYVDGALSGQAPWTLASKRGRQHRIVLKHRGYVTKTHVWTAGRSYTKTFVLEREMRLTLRSRPGEANVFVAGRWVGKTPHTLSMPVGKRVEVAVKKKKFLEQKFWWNFKKDTTKTVYLAPDFLNVP
ncbi:MAG: PEGA domain-containing protein, partial [Myxococcota bacterium]